jgi:putative ABC transport system permease protein
VFDLEQTLAKWKKAHRRMASIEDGDLAELESHLRDDVERLVKTGLSEEEAFAEVVRTSAGPEEVARELSLAHPGRGARLPRGVSRLGVPALVWNYVKLTLRKTNKEKGHALINVAGLAAGMACCMTIFLWVQDELGYDRFHGKGDRILRVFTRDFAGGETRLNEAAPAPIGAALVAEYPEVVNATRLQSGWSGWNLHLGDKNFSSERLAAVEPSLFEIFSFPFIEGDPKTALKDPHSIVLTESLARKFFGEEGALGKTLQINATDMAVTGVIKDIPRNSHIQFDYAFPAVNMAQWRSSKLDDWSYLQFATYIEVRAGTDWRGLGAKIAGMIKAKDPKLPLEVFLCPLKNVHFELGRLGNFVTQYERPGNLTTIYIFSIVGLLVLLLACVNYMNLATARSEHRSREVGVRKALGASRSDLIKQFFGESLTLTFIAFAFALLLVWLFLPTFNVLIAKSMSMASLATPRVFLGLLGIVLLTGLVSGSYPALYLSAIQPVTAIRRPPALGRTKGGTLRRVLVTGQFAVTIALIAVTAVIYGQLRYMETADLGYDKDNIVYFASYGDLGRNVEAAKTALLQNPDVLSVTKAFPPFGGRVTDEVEWEGQQPGRKILFTEDFGDHDYQKTFGFQMALGRYYSRDFPSDASSFVLNETAVREMGLADPLGKWVSYGGRKGPIIGVVEDFHGASMHGLIAPKIISLSNEGFFLCVKFRDGRTREVMAFLAKVWAEKVPGRPFRYHFVDDDVRRSYEGERKARTAFQTFAGLSIFIACLGLFGLVSFVAERRTKEIGIRKILGAGVPGIVRLITGEYVRWVLLSNLIAWPVAYFAARKWLSGFAYRIPLSAWIFVLSSALAMLLTILTVGHKSLRAATANPVESLRYE